jgi:hypothetical protein
VRKSRGKAIQIFEPHLGLASRWRGNLDVVDPQHHGSMIARATLGS